MNPKNTWLLVFVTAALFAFIFFFESRIKKPVPGPMLVLPGFKPAAITRVKIDLAGQLELVLDRTNDTWQLSKPLVWPARADAVENLLNAVAALAPKTRIPAQVLKSHRSLEDEYGFAQPQVTLVFQQADEEHQLILGNLTAPGDEIYAQAVSEDHVDIIDAGFFKKFIPRGPNDWRDARFIKWSAQPFDQLIVTDGAHPFELSREKTNQFWQMDKPVRTRADYPKIENLLGILKNLQATRFVADNVNDFENYGLEPAALDLQFNSGTNTVMDVAFGKSPTNDTNQVFARFDGQHTVVLVPRDAAAPWLGGYQEFRDRHLVRFDGGSPDIIEVSAQDKPGQENFTLEHQTNSEWLITKPRQFAADTNLMRAFLRNLSDLKVIVSNGEVAVKDAVLADSDFPNYGLAPPTRKYILKRSASPGASNTLIAEVDFGIKDAKVYARRADRADETSVYAVARADFDRLPARSFDLRDRRIWNFSVDDVTLISIRLNGKEQQIAHLGSHHWGVATNSQGLSKDDLLIEAGAQDLGTLEAQNWMECGDADRAQYGFTDNSLQISVNVTAAGKQQTNTVTFGGWSPLGLRYGDVRLADGQNWIFELASDIWEQLSTYFNIPESPPRR